MTMQFATTLTACAYALFVTALLFWAVVKIGRLEEEIDGLHRAMDREEMP